MVVMILLTIAAISKAIMDTLQFHYSKSIFRKLNPQLWNPAVSCKNKYKLDGKTPRFYGSTTFLVWLTDFWHFFQMIFLNSILLAIVFYHPIVCNVIDFIIFALYTKILFQIFFKNILIKNKKS